MRRVPQLIKLGLFVLAAALGLYGCSHNPTVEAAREDRQQPAATPAEQDFMIIAAQTDLAEIDMARIAMQKSQNSDVRDFANMIQSDQTSALEDLTDLMRKQGMSGPNVLSPEAKADIVRITALSGAEMDREFVNTIVAGLQKSIEMYRDHVSIAQSPEVGKYAEDLVPQLEMHLEKAQKLQSKLFGGGKP